MKKEKTQRVHLRESIYKVITFMSEKRNHSILDYTELLIKGIYNFEVETQLYKELMSLNIEKMETKFVEENHQDFTHFCNKRSLEVDCPDNQFKYVDFNSKWFNNFLIKEVTK